MEKNMEVEYGIVHKDRNILDNGNMVSFKVLVFIYLKMEIDMKDNLKILQKMGMEHNDIIMVKHMSDSLKKIDQMEKVNIFGLMEVITKVNL
jgi:hypothetical protein